MPTTVLARTRDIFESRWAVVAWTSLGHRVGISWRRLGESRSRKRSCCSREIDLPLETFVPFFYQDPYPINWIRSPLLSLRISRLRIRQRSTPTRWTRPVSRQSSLKDTRAFRDRSDVSSSADVEKNVNRLHIVASSERNPFVWKNHRFLRYPILSRIASSDRVLCMPNTLGRASWIPSPIHLTFYA